LQQPSFYLADFSLRQAKSKIASTKKTSQIASYTNEEINFCHPDEDQELKA